MPQLSREWLYWSLVNGIPAAIAATAFLVYPRFDRLFAWNVEDRRSAIFLGTGFLLRAALFVHVISATTWGEIRWLVWGNAVFAAVLLGVTMIWGERFKWTRPIAVIWLFLYIEEPVWMLTLVPRERAAAGAAALPGNPVNPLLQSVLLVEALVMLVAGLVLWRLNGMEKPRWPWCPDLVSARVMAGFPLGWVAWAPTLALAPSWAEARGGVLLNIIWLGAILASLAVFRRRFDLSRRSTQVYAGVTGGLFVLILLGYLLQR